MPNLSKKSKILIFLSLTITFLLILYLLGLKINIYPPFAPGCSKQTGLVFGGCFGKQTVTFQFKYLPKKCLDINFHTCTTPQFEIKNLCKQKLYVNNKKYDENDTYTYIEIEGSGFKTLTGKVGNTPFFILGYVTKPLCQ